ncbi:sarcosine oxidase subunit gamma [Roseobacter denitrificans OCh 114]|nr:sarcosine oxidase subunit gamma [Roseobacter denitrificans OCh 114]
MEGTCVVELTARSACLDILPVKIGSMTLVEADLGTLTSISPFQDQQVAVSDALTQAYGLAFPAPNRTTGEDRARAIWFGRETAVLVGAPVPPGLDKIAAITDQSDAWACVTLSGPGHTDALARLVPVDLRLKSFEVGHTTRTLLGHMHASITRTAPDEVLILVFRSMAVTLVDELKEAMEAVAARG